MVDVYLKVYHLEQNHHGLDGRIAQPTLEVGAANERDRRRQSRGGMLNSNYRDAARSSQFLDQTGLLLRHWIGTVDEFFGVVAL